jgi:DNA-binding NtrC family response regulator
LRPHILLIDDDRIFTEDILHHLGDKYDWDILLSGLDAVKSVVEIIPDVVLLDINLGSGPDGFDILREIRIESPHTPVIMVTRYDPEMMAKRAWRQGAFGYIEKGSSIDQLAAHIERAIEEATLWRENRILREEVASNKGILIGESHSMKELREQIKQVSKTSSTVLITGETGTGKELIAREIHERSSRINNIFIPVCCPALPKELIESELFGHEKGAFTGALTRRIGKFEQADRGTIFLDEISEIDISLQSKLLRVLQEKCITRVGGSKEISVDVRVLAATNKDLESLMKEGLFRDDLYYRLCVVPIHSPPLREKREDIPLLAQHILDRKAAELNHSRCTLSHSAINRFLSWDWPGNIRELENVLENAMVRSSDRILNEDLFIGMIGPKVSNLTYVEAKMRVLEKFETDYLNAVLTRCRGNISETARQMGLTREGVRKMMKRRGFSKGSSDIHIK